MANTSVNPYHFYVQGDGVATTVAIHLGFSPTSITFISAITTGGVDISSNITSAVLAGSTVNVTFVAAFSYLVDIILSIDPTIKNIDAVTGTFWQATQPISGSISFAAPQHTIVDSATLGTVAVSGTFWQATQPVSLASTTITGTVTVVQPTGTSLHTVIDSGTITTVSTVTAVTAITNALPTGANTIGKVDILGNTGAVLDGVITAATAPANGLAQLVVYQTTVPALTAGQSVAVQSDTSGATFVNTTGRAMTYRMAVKSFIPVASATSPTFSIQGSATKTVRILRIVVSTSCLTGTGTPFKSDLVLQKYSVLTGGTTGSTPTGSLMDSGNAAQTAVCLQYSAVPTTATAIGGLHAAELIQMITPTATANGITRNEWDFGDKNGQGLVLRGAAQYLGITINPLGATPLMSVWIEWIEDNS
jgi:hypothetical protein